MKNVTVQPIKPVYVTLVFAWNSLAGILLLPQLQLLVCSIILPVVALPAFLCNTVTSCTDPSYNGKLDAIVDLGPKLKLILNIFSFGCYLTMVHFW